MCDMIEQAFGDSLAKNASLRHLNLDSNPLTAGEVDFDGIRQLAAALGKNTTLTSLNLHRFGDCSIVACIAYSSHVLHGRCGLKEKGGRAISAGLDHNHTLLFVDVGNNGLDLQEERHIAEKLVQNIQR